MPLTSFIGREREIAELSKILDTTRLLTLTGAGGAGKTRLSLEVAAEVLDTFRDGVWFVELALMSVPGDPVDVHPLAVTTQAYQASDFAAGPHSWVYLPLVLPGR